MKKYTFLLLILLSILVVFSCGKESIPDKYKTENVIVVVIDGARYSETWGDTLHQYIPYFANEISKTGIVNTNFYNNGQTYTLAGHCSLSTGNYQEINNSGNENPYFPSIFQYWNYHKYEKANLSWIISSKDKLESLNNCNIGGWNNKGLPSTNCGISGLGSGYREDSTSYNELIQILTEHHPKLVLFSFRDPDFSAHSGNWNSYIQGIINTDRYAFQIWNFIRNDSYYKNKTTLFITNDHGRHLDSIADGFISHGDTCLGCRHINLFAYGPDFKKGQIIDTKRELIDIPATIAELLQIKTTYMKGEVMHELFEKDNK